MLKKVEATGGPPQVICEAPGFTGGDWNAEGTILFGSAKGLFRCSDQGGRKSRARHHARCRRDRPLLAALSAGRPALSLSGLVRAVVE
jgi:hypothetical protein